MYLTCTSSHCSYNTYSSLQVHKEPIVRWGNWPPHTRFSFGCNALFIFVLMLFYTQYFFFFFAFKHSTSSSKQDLSPIPKTFAGITRQLFGNYAGVWYAVLSLRNFIWLTVIFHTWGQNWAGEYRNNSFIADVQQPLRNQRCTEVWLRGPDNVSHCMLSRSIQTACDWGI